MPDENPIPDGPAERLERVEKELLYLLADDMDGQQVWSVADLARQISNPDDASLALRGLHAAGLLNQTTDGFVVATRAGIRAVAMIGAVI
jgi:hypothetical protein